MNALITANFDDDHRQYLETECGIDIDYRPIRDRSARFSERELRELLDGVEIFVVGYESVPESLIASLPNLELIACTRGGPDANVDIKAARTRDIPVLYAPGRNAESVADFTLGLILGVARHIPRSHHLLHTGTFTGTPVGDTVDGGEREDVVWGVGPGSPYTELKGFELRDRTLGLIGFGAIGRRVAQRAQAFGMEVLVYDPYVDEETLAEHDVKRASLSTVCERGDVISIHCKVTPETRGLIGAAEIESMSDDAYVINTARAAIVDQDALVDALENDAVGGVALDVYDREPLPEDHPLFAFDNVVTTPHIAAATEDVIRRHSEQITADIERWLDGETPRYEFTSS